MNGLIRTATAALLLSGLSLRSGAHNVGNAITWNREISRVFYQRCVSCHHPKRTAFPLLKFPDVQPRAAEIKDAVLSRRMPPWGAVKGFGDFRNDQGLSQEELELITDWVDSSTPKGNNPNVLPSEPKWKKPSIFKLPKDAIGVSGALTLSKGFTLGGLFPQNVQERTSIKIVALLPDGHVEPLLWLYEYRDSHRHPFLLRSPLRLPAGSVIQGVPTDARIFLLPGK